METKANDKVYWHGAFFEALQLEFHQYRDSLAFFDEHQLSKESLVIDVIVIKKAQGVQIKKNIGEIFRGHNLFEYKSERDSLGVRDYDKVMGYAYLYASFTPANVNDMTVSFAVTVHPRELLACLASERGLTVSDSGSGIFRIGGEAFPVQIIESKKLPRTENLFLRNLRSSLDADDVKETAKAYRELRAFDSRNVYLDKLIQANYKSFMEAMEMGEAAKKLFFEAGEKYGWFAEVLATGEAGKKLFFEAGEKYGWFAEVLATG